MSNPRIWKSYVWHQEKCFFVSTIHRTYDAPAGAFQGVETLVLDYDWDKADRGIPNCYRETNTMKSLNLQNLTPSERVAKLNEAVAVEAGPPYAQRNAAPGFTPAESADAILKLIEENGWFPHIGRPWDTLKPEGRRVWEVAIYSATHDRLGGAESTLLAESIAIAYLRAKGWEVVT